VSDDAASAPAGVRAGEKIAGYRLEEQIGQGGMAVVYRAHDERLDRRVALKLLAPGLAADTAFRTRFIRESRAAAAVDHPNIIPVYDAGDAGGFLFISMRYVQGGDVRSLVADGHPLEPARAWSIIGQVAAALDAAHAQGLVHRDVKPANMLLDARSQTNHPRRSDSGSYNHVYLSDFGISKQSLASNLTSTGQFVGTLDYIAPEQIEGHGIDGRADQYSLACAAFELLCGAPPFQRPTGLALISAHLAEQVPSAVARRPELPASVDLVLAKAMAKSPVERYASCTQFAADLGRALGLAPGQLEAGPQPAGAGASGPPTPAPATQFAEPMPPVPGGQLVADAATMNAEPRPGAAPYYVPHQTPPPGQAPFGRTPPPGQAPFGQTPPPGQTPQPQYPTDEYPPAVPYPPGQYPPAQYPTSPPPHRRSRGLVVGVVVATVALAVAAAAVTYALVGKNTGSNASGHSSSSRSAPPKGSSTPPSSSSPPTAAGQAHAISSLLSASEATRVMLGPAVEAIENNCYSLTSTQIATDVMTIRTVATQRRSEYSRAQALQVSALTDGAQLKADLENALMYSLSSDNDFLRWAQQEQAGCTPTSSSAAFQAAGTTDSESTAAKTSFANLWNTIGPGYGYPAVNPDKF
jgi:hypothetical protein